MNRRTIHLVALSLLLAVASCDIQLQLFLVPTQAVSGTMFEIRVSAGFSGTAGIASGVLQLPNGFAMVGYASSTMEPVLASAAPTAIYTAEPGTHLVGFSGGGAPNPVTTQGTIQVFVRTTPGLTGTFHIKVALGVANGSAWIAQDPPQTQFASINDAAHRKSIVLVPAPFTDFAFDSDGLPITGGGGTTARPWFSSTCGDIDGDGNADIVAVDTANGLRHFRSQPHSSPPAPGTVWTEQGAVLTPASPAARCAIADLDGDGAMDVMRGDGTPIFRSGTQWVVGATPPLLQPGSDSVAIGDVDHDGRPDVALGGHTSKTLQVLLNNGDRTFRDSSTGLPNFPGQPTTHDTVLFADFDGDGNLDLFWVTNAGSFAFLGNGHGGWTAATLPLFVTDGDAVAVDIDGDGVLEIVTARGTVLRYFVNNVFAQMTGTGLEALGTGATLIEALDFDRDGDMDLAVASNLDRLELWRNDSTGRFTRYLSCGLPDQLVPGIVDLTVGDIDGNNWPDLVVTVDGTGVFAFQNLNTGVAPFGAGCSGLGVQVPTLQAIGSPTRGNAAFALRLHSTVGSVLGGIWFDGDRTHLGTAPLPLDLAQFGAQGCALLVPPTFLSLGLIDTGGNLTVPLAVPPTPALARATFFAQGCAFVLTANPAGGVLTAGVAIRID